MKYWGRGVINLASLPKSPRGPKIAKIHQPFWVIKNSKLYLEVLAVLEAQALLLAPVFASRNQLDQWMDRLVDQVPPAKKPVEKAQVK